MYRTLYPRQANQSYENYVKGKISNPSGKISSEIGMWYLYMKQQFYAYKNMILDILCN